MVEQLTAFQRAINSARAAAAQVEAAYARIGAPEHPDGLIPLAYGQARAAMPAAWAAGNRLAASAEVLRDLRMAVLSGLREELQEAQEFGRQEAARQLRLYGVSCQTAALGLDTELQTALDALALQLETQSENIRGLALLGGKLEQAVGNEFHSGALAAGPVMARATYWLGALTWHAFGQWVARWGQAERFEKVAVTPLDERATYCCLRVHGQAQAMGGDFELSGTPRYAEMMAWPPFHAHCRTALALRLTWNDGGMLAQMRVEAEAAFVRKVSERLT